MTRMLELIACLLILLTMACSGKPAKAPATEAEAKATPGPAADLLGAYERLRTQLANDQPVSTSDFESVASAARAAAALYSGGAKEGLERVVKAAESGASRSNDLKAAREGFGQVSRGLLAFLSEAPEVAQGRFVFECPMTKTYRKWVQNTSAVSNPYMGTAMSTCGVGSDWQP